MEQLLQPLLLDARTEAEYDASHLPGALRADSAPLQLGIEGKFDQPLVVYCTVGFDSAPVAVRYILDAVNRGLQMPLPEAQLFEATLFGLVAATEDMREGTTAFLEKRKAEFRGK